MKTGLACVLFVVACGGGDDGGGGPRFGDAHPRIYLGPNADRLKAALAAQTPAAKRFQSMVDDAVGGDDIYGFPAWNAALMGQLTGDPKYCAKAIAMVDKQVNDANDAISSGNTPDVASDDYLDIGDDIGDLALTYDWCSSMITGDQQTKWLAYGQQAVFNVWNPDQAKWGSMDGSWDGWAIDDPADNYYYSFLRATMLFGLAAHDDLPDANQWLTQFHDTKLMNELIPEFNSDLVGGGSREGTGYGVSLRGLFELYDWWQASTGEDIANKTPHTRASMLDFMHQVVPTLDRIAPTGDQSRDSTASLFDYHREYLQKLIYQFPTDPQAPRAQALLAQSSLPKMSQQFEYAYDFLYDNSNVATGDLTQLGTAYFAPGTGQLFARSGWDTHATWLNFIGGPYTQSHAHQDQSALTIYKDGWLAYDPVIDSHSGLPQETTAHNVVRLVGSKTIPQENDASDKMKALHSGPGWVHAAADISPVYSKGQTVQREIVYLQPDVIVVYDRVTTTSGTQVWQMAMPQQPSTSGTRTTMTASGHTLSIERVQPANATPSVFDYSTDSDFSGGFRLDETVDAGDNRFLHVIWIDGAIGTVTPQTDGVSLAFGDGGTATVTFSHGAIGGTLVYNPANGTAVNETLGAGIDTLPE